MVWIKSLTRIYSGPCILRPPIQPEKCGLKLTVCVLKWMDIYIENISMVPRMVSCKTAPSLKMEGS